MAIFSLLVLGLSRGGQPARAERVLILTCAGAGGVMNVAAANDASPESVLAYVTPPVFLAVVVGPVSASADLPSARTSGRRCWLPPRWSCTGCGWRRPR
jgi:hypothetical protein